MSRIIKFRAWDGKYKKMHFKVLVGNTQDGNFDNYHAHGVYLRPGDTDYKIEPPGCWMNFDEHSDFVLMQFTGLHDKNGVEIYEGDIVQQWELSGYDKKRKLYEYSPIEDKISVVEYHHHGFWIKDESFGWEGEGLWDWLNLVVIGNVFQHAHLLTTEIK